jgi:hypothetical protein
MHPLSFFTQRIGSSILCNDKPVEVKNSSDAQYWFDTQSKLVNGEPVRFKEMPTNKPRIHISDSACVSCEG